MNTPRPNTVLASNVTAYSAHGPWHDCSLEVWRRETHECQCCIRGYQVYQDVLEAAVDKELVCPHDRYAVAVINNLVVGHIPSKV